MHGGRSSLAHPITDAAHSQDKTWGCWVVAQFAPQIGDVNVDDVIVSEPRGVPDLIDDLFAGQSNDQNLWMVLGGVT